MCRYARNTTRTIYGIWWAPSLSSTCTLVGYIISFHFHVKWDMDRKKESRKKRKTRREKLRCWKKASFRHLRNGRENVNYNSLSFHVDGKFTSLDLASLSGIYVILNLYYAAMLTCWNLIQFLKIFVQTNTPKERKKKFHLPPKHT